MFLRFTIENHASFRDEAEVSFISTSRSEEPEWRMASPHVRHGVLPVVGLWGGNAAGKTQVLKALRLLQSAVRFSQTRWEPTAALPWNPFRGQEDGPPTVMEIEFLIEQTRYAFGFAFTSAGFVEEWLYRWETSRRQVIYHRDESRPEGDRFYPGPSLRGPRQAAWEITRPTSLFLSAAAQQGNDMLTPVYDKIGSGIRRERPIALKGYPVFPSDHPIVGRFRPRLVRLLQRADLGVVDAEVERHEASTSAKVDLEELEKIFNPDFLAQLPSRAPPAELVRLRLVHRGAEGSTWELDPRLESRGTQVLIARFSDIAQTLDSGGLLVIDEVETSLHPDLCAALVDLFTHEQTNPKGAQLLFATHDRGLLGRLRSDEVALLDKSSDGASRIRTASDYSGIRKRDDLRTAHERGRIGGVPVLGDLAAAVSD